MFLTWHKKTKFVDKASVFLHFAFTKNYNFENSKIYNFWIGMIVFKELALDIYENILKVVILGPDNEIIKRKK